MPIRRATRTLHHQVGIVSRTDVAVILSPQKQKNKYLKYLREEFAK